MKKILTLFLGVTVWLTLAAGSVEAGVEVTWKSYPTVGLEGYTTYIVSVESDIGGFKGFGIYFETEHFNQIRVNGMSTPTQDSNHLFQFINKNPLQDTQVMTVFTDVEQCGMPGDCIQETDTWMGGNQIFRQYQESWDLAQLVVPAGNTINYKFNVVISTVEYWVFGVIPEPASFAIFAGSGLVLLLRRSL